MQDDWIKYLVLAKFADNNAVAAETEMTSFYVNKDFHSRMSFTSNNQIYNTAKERIQAAKVSNIIKIMRNVLKLTQSNMKKTQKFMKRFADRRRKKVSY